ncbi:MAG: type II toxin-antitoxin system VapC family toxin [Planctomycetota bacterium]
MILVDANLLLYAEDSQAALHARARSWWDERLSGDDPVCLCWTVLTAFVRIGTNPRVYQRPLTIGEAVERVQSWLEQPCVRVIHATGRHLEVFAQLLATGQATANLVPDAHLAALAIEHGCVLCLTDGDFARFPGLSWKNPLA